MTAVERLELVERVAKVLCQQKRERIQSLEPKLDLFDWNNLDEDVRGEFREDALAAIEATHLTALTEEVSRLREALGDLEHSATATLAAIDAYNEANGTHLGGPHCFRLGRRIAAALALKDQTR